MTLIRRRNILLGAGGTALGAAGLAATTQNASAASKRFVVATANIGRKQKQNRESSIKAVRQGWGDFMPLVGWQEIGEGDGDMRERRFINKWFWTELNYTNYFFATNAYRIPMSIPTTVWRVVRKNQHKVHGGKAKVSPPRWITELLLEHRGTGMRFAMLNMHYVAGAWNGRDDPHEQWRKDMWHKMFQAHGDRIAHWRDRGHPVIWTGDANRGPGMPKFANAERRPFNGIDKIGLLPGSSGVQLDVVDKRTVDMNVDGHDARLALLEISN